MKRQLLAVVLVAIGVACLGSFGMRAARRATFQQQQDAALRRTLAVPSALIEVPAARFSRGETVGRLEIPRVKLSVIVLEGDDDATLSKAVGHLPDTVMPWETGNSALAGHRDTFFSPLQYVKSGDEVRLTSVRGTFLDKVDEAQIVSPDDVAVVAPTSEPVLTLVTCYPFFYVGSAPKRYVVKATRVEAN